MQADLAIAAAARRVWRRRADRPRRVVRRRPAHLVRHEHVGAGVLDRLEAPDRLAELVAHLGVRHRHLERLTRAADRLERERGGAGLERAIENGPAP